MFSTGWKDFQSTPEIANKVVPSVVASESPSTFVFDDSRLRRKSSVRCKCDDDMSHGSDDIFHANAGDAFPTDCESELNESSCSDDDDTVIECIFDLDEERRVAHSGEDSDIDDDNENRFRRGSSRLQDEGQNQRSMLKVGDGIVPDRIPFVPEKVSLREVVVETINRSSTEPRWVAPSAMATEVMNNDELQRVSPTEGNSPSAPSYSVNNYIDRRRSTNSPGASGGVQSIRRSYVRQQKNCEIERMGTRKLKIGNGEIPVRDPFVPENVELREASIEKKEYYWEKPEWTKFRNLEGSPGRHGQMDESEACISPSLVKRSLSMNFSQTGSPSAWRRASIGRSPSYRPESPGSLREDIKLRNAEIQKREVKWEQPEWVRKNLLRRTSKREKIATQGDLTRSMDEVKGTKSHTPDWVTLSPIRMKKNSRGGGPPSLSVPFDD